MTGYSIDGRADLFVAAAGATRRPEAGATRAARDAGGLEWLPVSFVLAIAVAAINAWVLLVEILR